MSDDLAAGHPGIRARARGEAEEDTFVTIERIEAQDRIFIIKPALKLRALRTGDEFYVMDERLNLAARGTTLQALRDEICRTIPEIWDRYTHPGITPADDGYKIGRALRHRMRVESRPT